MEITIAEFNTHIQSAYEFVVKEYGKLRDHTVKLAKPYLELIQKDPRAAGATVAVANIIFFETAMKICEIIDKLVNRWVKDSDLGGNSQIAKSLITLGLFVGMVSGMNVAMVKLLKLPLSPMMVAAISTAACSSYVFLRLLWEFRKER